MIEKLIYKMPRSWHEKLPHSVKVLLNPWMKKVGDPPTDPPGKR